MMALKAALAAPTTGCSTRWRSRCHRCCEAVQHDALCGTQSVNGRPSCCLSCPKLGPPAACSTTACTSVMLLTCACLCVDVQACTHGQVECCRDGQRHRAGNDLVHCLVDLRRCMPWRSQTDSRVCTSAEISTAIRDALTIWPRPRDLAADVSAAAAAESMPLFALLSTLHSKTPTSSPSSWGPAHC